MQNGSVTFFFKEHMFWNFQNRNSIFRLWSCLWTWSVTYWTDTIQASRGEKKELKFSLIIVLSGSLYQNIYSSNQRCFLSSVGRTKRASPKQVQYIARHIMWCYQYTMDTHFTSTQTRSIQNLNARAIRLNHLKTVCFDDSITRALV